MTEQHWSDRLPADVVERLSDELGICRECGEDLPDDLLRWSIESHEECT